MIIRGIDLKSNNKENCLFLKSRPSVRKYAIESLVEVFNSKKLTMKNNVETITNSCKYCFNIELLNLVNKKIVRKIYK